MLWVPKTGIPSSGSDLVLVEEATQPDTPPNRAEYSVRPVGWRHRRLPLRVTVGLGQLHLDGKRGSSLLDVLSGAIRCV
jgi:hypothetical protein